MSRLLRLLFMALVLLPAGARAQTPAPAPLVVERVRNPFVVAPDYKVTDLDGDLGQLAGAYAGRVFDDLLFIGGAAHWLVNGDRGERLTYGGVVVGSSLPQWGVVRFGVRALTGLGSGRLQREVNVLRPADRAIRFGRTTAPGGTVRVLASDDFFVFEPEVNAAINLLPHVGLNIGAGYRLTGMTDALEDHLNGATGNLAIQFEW
jgi:hypothetical protein